ncbi:PEPxxWA-CTERM sorting domain-containing protein [Sphingomonas sp.]|uniref:PEPxxWA-CTERM sorting domain-containing protein n=1 Tax=Sphingomonas sp. TaxID=28214 RepID=UPI002FDB26D6
MNINKLAIAAIIFGAPVPAFAQINAPVPTANYITFGGNDWAWASPCPPSGGYKGETCGDGSAINLSYQGTLGWRLPTATELAAGPSVTNFGTWNSFACASAWFTASYSHCDYGDAQSGAVFGTAGGNVWYAETWVIRGDSAVPEPAAWAMLIGGFAISGGALRRRRLVRVAYSA